MGSCNWFLVSSLKWHLQQKKAAGFQLLSLKYLTSPSTNGWWFILVVEPRNPWWKGIVTLGVSTTKTVNHQRFITTHYLRIKITPPKTNMTMDIVNHLMKMYLLLKKLGDFPASRFSFEGTPNLLSLIPFPPCQRTKDHAGYLRFRGVGPRTHRWNERWCVPEGNRQPFTNLRSNLAPSKTFSGTTR